MSTTSKMQDEIQIVYEQEEGWMETRFYAFIQAFAELLREKFNLATDELQFHYVGYCHLGFDKFCADFTEEEMKLIDPIWLDILRKWKK